MVFFQKVNTYFFGYLTVYYSYAQVENYLIEGDKIDIFFNFI